MTKESVRQFYDEQGWQPTDEAYVDTQRYVDRRPVVQAYIRRCDARAAAALAPAGRLFLDLGCGAKPKETLSAGYRYHVCVDFSRRGLQEARRKLGARGLYVVADVTDLPFAPGTFDAVISAHVIYHIPGLASQRRAFQEVHRMVGPGRTGAILYSNPYHNRYFDLTWGVKGAARNGLRLVRDLLDRMRGRPHWAADRPEQMAPPPGELFYKSYPPGWIRRFLPRGAADIRCLGWLTQPFTRRHIKDTAGGRRFLRAVSWLEDRFPHALARVGHYVLVVVRKDEAA